jgi:hypothetical protein
MRGFREILEMTDPKALLPKSACIPAFNSNRAHSAVPGRRPDCTVEMQSHYGLK